MMGTMGKHVKCRAADCFHDDVHSGVLGLYNRITQCVTAAVASLGLVSPGDGNWRRHPYFSPKKTGDLF